MAGLSVLAYIVPRLSIQVENAASACLQFILSEHPEAAAGLAEYLRPAGINLPATLAFSTQAVIWHRRAVRPDICGSSGDEQDLIIEAKFHAPLTDGQPVDYVWCLPKKSAGLLLFLVPAARLDELWQEVKGRCEAQRIPVGERVQYANGLAAASLQQTHRLAIASWESLLAAIEKHAQNDARALADVEQLCSLCDELLSGKFANLELRADPNRGRPEPQMRSMVDQIVAGLVGTGHAKLKGYRATPGSGYYKRYMTLAGCKNWCVEFNTEYWARFGQSVIWLSGNTKWMSADDAAALETMFANSFARRLREEVLIPLLATHAGSEAEAREHLLTQAVSVATRLAAVPTPAEDDS